MSDEEASKPESLSDYGYTAFEKWDYRQIIYKTDQEQSWRDMGNSYFMACRPLVATLAAGQLREDIEGTAAVYLFRHYLELMLKRIVLSGRLLVSENQIAIRDEVQKVANTHNLGMIWKWVLADAKPKLKEWDNYDIDSVEKCVAEFDEADKKGVAFRYDHEGGEHCRFDFQALDHQMDHLRVVLEGVWTCLYEMRAEIADYEAELQSEFGSDMYW